VITAILPWLVGVLASGSVCGLLALALDLPVTQATRLGLRGAQRAKACARNSVFTCAEPLVRWCASLIALVPLGNLRNRIDTSLRSAEYWLGLTPDEFLALSAITSIGCGLAAQGFGAMTGQGRVFVLPALLFGFALPAMKVRELIRQRVKEVTRSLPGAIEIAALCMGAGLDFPGALRFLAQPSVGSPSALNREFAAILDDLTLGHTRRDALLGFAERVPAQAVRDFVNAVVQAEQKGNPLAKVIQVQGRTLSAQRSVAAEESAARAGVLMVGPMMLLLGCILLLLMGPFIVQGIGF
jgi:tight adherence protein C